MNNTTNYGYNLPEYLEDADVVILNQNFTAIDKDILDVRQIAVLMYDSDETYNTDDLVGYENPTDHHIRMFRCLEDNVTGVWDSTKWANTNVAAELLRRSGGGTEVEANPSGSATDYLTKVKIGNTIYAVTPADMTGATSQAAGAHGLVPAPSAGDEGKVLYGDGTWKTPQSASSNLDDLGDVTLTTPSDGQTLTYDDGEWVNKDPAVTKTATGNPIEISDGANAPLVKCVSAITGSQDLHGYDKPWVGGAYINKMPPGEAISTSRDGVTITSDGNGTYTFVGTCTQDFEVTFDCDNFTIPSADNSAVYLFNSEANVNTVFVFYNGTTVVDTWSLSPVNRVSTYTGMKGLPCNKYGMRLKSGATYNLTFKPMIAVRTSYTEWYPYSNICPITAYTEGEIEVRGKNLVEETYANGNINANGVVVANQTGYDLQIAEVKEGVTYTITSDELFVGAFYYTKPTTGSVSYNGSRLADVPKTFTSPITGYVAFCTAHNYATPQLEEGETATPYSPYTSTTHTTTFPDAIYRGSEDVVNGEVTKEWGMIASYAGETLPGEWISDRDEYAPGTTPTTGAQVAYELAAPTTTTVTPTNLPIRTISGYSHIESSTGDMEIEYITGKYQPIVDLISESSGGDSQHHYSTNEQVVGTWVDGGNVYELTLSGTFSNTSTSRAWNEILSATQVTALGINRMFLVGGYTVEPQSGEIYPLPMATGVTTGVCVGCIITDGAIKVVTEGFTGGTVEYALTIRYTKTSTRSLSKGTTETEKTSLEPISEPLETKVDSLSKDEIELKEEDESKEIEEVTEEPEEEPTEEPEEEPVDPEPSKEEADER